MEWKCVERKGRDKIYKGMLCEGGEKEFEDNTLIFEDNTSTEIMLLKKICCTAGATVGSGCHDVQQGGSFRVHNLIDLMWLEHQQSWWPDGVELPALPCCAKSCVSSFQDSFFMSFLLIFITEPPHHFDTGAACSKLLLALPQDCN